MRSNRTLEPTAAEPRARLPALSARLRDGRRPFRGDRAGTDHTARCRRGRKAASVAVGPERSWRSARATTPRRVPGYGRPRPGRPKPEVGWPEQPESRAARSTLRSACDGSNGPGFPRWNRRTRDHGRCRRSAWRRPTTCPIRLLRPRRSRPHLRPAASRVRRPSTLRTNACRKRRPPSGWCRASGRDRRGAEAPGRARAPPGAVKCAAPGLDRRPACLEQRWVDEGEVGAEGVGEELLVDAFLQPAQLPLLARAECTLGHQRLASSGACLSIIRITKTRNSSSGRRKPEELGLGTTLEIGALDRQPHVLGHVVAEDRAGSGRGRERAARMPGRARTSRSRRAMSTRRKVGGLETELMQDLGEAARRPGRRAGRGRSLRSPTDRWLRCSSSGSTRRQRDRDARQSDSTSGNGGRVIWVAPRESGAE